MIVWPIVSYQKLDNIGLVNTMLDVIRVYGTFRLWKESCGEDIQARFQARQSCLGCICGVVHGESIHRQSYCWQIFIPSIILWIQSSSQRRSSYYKHRAPTKSRRFGGFKWRPYQLRRFVCQFAYHRFRLACIGFDRLFDYQADFPLEKRSNL